MAIWVIKDGQREGPYEEQDVRELLYEGTYADGDAAIRDGQFDWSTLGEILGRRGPALEATPTPPGEAPAPAPAPLVPLPLLPPPLVPPPPGAAAAEPPPLPAAAVAVAAPPEAPLQSEADSRPIQVAVVDFQMPFGSMVMLMVKWVLASIPALAILAVIAALFWGGFLAIISAALRY